MSKEASALKTREEVPKELTWDLEAIFETDEKWEEEYKQLAEKIPKIHEYQGKVTESADTLLELFKLQDNFALRLGKLYAYSHMSNDEDTTNAKYQAMDARAESILTIASSEMSFTITEILIDDETKIKEFRAATKEINE